MDEISVGTRLHVIHTEKFKTSVICILIRRPLSKQESTINALIPNILKRGSAKYDTLTKLNAATEGMYGSIFESQIVKKGEEQILQFFIETINGDVDIYTNAIDFLKEIILYPLVEGGGFRQAYTEGEIDNLRHRIDGRINNKSEYAKLKCLEHMCIDEPFGIYGDGYADDLSSLDPVKIYEHYRVLLETSPIDIIFIGNADNNQIKELIGSHFSLDESNGISRIDIVSIPPASFSHIKKERETHEEDHGSVQGKLSIGCRSGVNPVGADFYRLLTANEILGGCPNSRFFSTIREQESLCYTINSFIYRFKSILMIQSGVDPQNFEKVIGLVEKELDGIKNGNISDEEFDAGKSSLIKKFKGIQDYQSATIDFYISQYMLGDEDRLEDVIATIEAANKEDVCAASRGIDINQIMLLR